MKGKKTGGRQKGTPNQTTEQTREWAAKLKKKHNVDRVIAEVMKKGKLSDKLILWRLLTEYERGKPLQPISGKDGGPIEGRVVIVNDIASGAPDV